MGYEFECLTDVTVSHVGRPLNGTMNHSHTVYIWSAGTTSLLASAVVSPDSPVDEQGFKVAQLDAPVTLQAGQRYRIVSSETIGGDRWYDVDQDYDLIPTADSQITTPVYTDPGAHTSYPRHTYNPGGVKGYVGVTFYYQVDSAVYGSSKYSINITMPETEAYLIFEQEEEAFDPFVDPPKITPVGSNQIILHLGLGRARRKGCQQGRDNLSA